ncbi:hypothetical protein [Desulfopila aestuarii]|uniref:hypothetical protein n=1 Tax=Desulfopila aestuarii TaxID=231440 RepID=UPI001160E9DD|nr:hypothetical protein [Desulfopila aestuarii]
MKSEIPIPQDRLTRGVQISKGLDRLKIGLYVQFNFELLFDVLGDRKAEAQEERQTIPIRLGADENYDYNCHGSGRKGGYNFHISRGDVNIFVSTRKDWMKTPNILIDIGSASCWAPGYKTVLEYVTKLLRIYGGKVVRNSVSEVHFCVDFIGLPIEELDLGDHNKWITRANKFNSFQDRAKFSGIQLMQDEGDLGFSIETGIRLGLGDICLRVYDKVYEIKRNNSKQSLFASVWGKEGYNDCPVTRVEFQLRKNVLKQFRCISLEDLYRKASGLWAYCTYKWSRFCEEPFDRENRHQDRARIHPWWKQVQAVKWGGLQTVIRKKLLAQKDKKMLRDMMGGCALNIAAIRMVNSQNTEEIIAVMTAEIEEWARALDKQKNQRTGRSELQEKMETKINEVWPYGPGEVHGPTARDTGFGLHAQCKEFHINEFN